MVGILPELPSSGPTFWQGVEKAEKMCEKSANEIRLQAEFLTSQFQSGLLFCNFEV